MNRKGFTLIELLAVIVLLGLLTAFLLPAVSKYIIQTRDNTYTLYEADMKTSAQNMMNECVEENKANCFPKDGLKKRLTLSELVSTGFSERLRDPKNDTQECDPFKSFVTVRNDDSNVTNLTYDVCLVCGEYKSNYCDSDEAKEIISETGCALSDDTTPPVCGVAVGSSTIWTNKDREIIIGCSDECSGCVQDTFSTKINYDAETAVIEIADNSGKRTNCTVDAYVDKTKPTCTLEVVGTVGDNGWYKSGTTPKVILKTKTDATSGIATYGLGTSKSNYDFNKETEYTVQDGITTVYGYVKDNAGNIGVCHTEEIKYDSVPPTIKNVDYGTVVYPKADIATKSGATITLNNITLEYGIIYGVYIYMNNGTGGTVTIKEGSNTLRSNLTIPSSTSKLKNNFLAAKSYSALSFTFGSATEANNVSRIELLTRNDSGYYTNQNVTMYINSMDSISGKAQYSFDDGSTWQNDNFKTYSTLKTIKMKASDSSGNTTDTTTKNITNIDKTAPKCTVSFGTGITIHENNYYWNNVPAALTKDDNAATSSYAMSTTRRFGLKDSNGLEYNGQASGTQTKDTTGTVWYGYVIDKAGNTSTCNSTVKKDSQDPSCTLTKNGTEGVEEWYRGSSVTILFGSKQDNNKDGSQSGLAYYQINTSSGNPSSWTTQISNTQTADTPGTTWYGHVKDVAGHTSSCSTSVKKDSVAPTCSIGYRCTEGNDHWCVGDVYVRLGRSGDTGSVQSGVIGWGINAYNKLDSMDMKTDTKSQTMTGYVRDRAGNECTATTTYKRDTTPPTCTLNKTTTYDTRGVVAHFDCTDATSGFDGYLSFTYFSWYKTTQTTDMYDLAGNKKTETLPITSGTRYRTNTCTQYTGASNSYCDCQTYNSCETSACGVYLYNRCVDAGCATYSGWVLSETEELDKNGASCSSYNEENTYTKRTCSNSGDVQYCYCRWFIRSCTKYKRSSVCGVESYNSCENSACGCYSYYWCRDSRNGCDSWSGWTGSDTYYPDASCTSSTNVRQCSSATVYW